MQNDFCTGALANKDAVAAIPRIKAELQSAKAEGMNIIFTRDTHGENYMQTCEGKHLPVPHCIKGTEGWEVVKELMEETDENTLFIDKLHFGFDGWDEYIKEGDEVTICGTCTAICVAANVSAIKMIENVEVNVIADCCAGLTKEKHDAALDVMASCQCTIK